MDYLFSLHKLITFAAEKKEERQKDRVDQDFVVYRIAEKGNYSPEDLVMMPAFTSYYNTKKSVIHISCSSCLLPIVPT